MILTEFSLFSTICNISYEIWIRTKTGMQNGSTQNKSCGNTRFCNAFYRRILGFIEHGFCAYRKPAAGYDGIQKSPAAGPGTFSVYSEMLYVRKTWNGGLSQISMQAWLPGSPLRRNQVGTIHHLCPELYPAAKNCLICTATMRSRSILVSTLAHPIWGVISSLF